MLTYLFYQRSANQYYNETISDGMIRIKKKGRDLTGGSLIKSLPCNAGDAGSVSGQGTRISQVMEELWSPHATSRESLHHMM